MRLINSYCNVLPQESMYCKKVAEYKRNNNIPMMQPDRVKIVLENVCLAAEKYGLSREFIKKIYAEMHKEIFDIEDKIIEAH